jgi:hypothetical protein
MSAPVRDLLQTAVTLRRGLDATAEALAHADLEGLLTCETTLHAALTQLSSSRIAPDDRAALLREIAQARTALHRCRRFGAAMNDLIRIRLAAEGLDGGYAASGAGVSATRPTIDRTV